MKNRVFMIQICVSKMEIEQWNLSESQNVCDLTLWDCSENFNKNVRDLRVLSHLPCDNLTVVDLLKASNPNPNNNIFVTAPYFLMCLLKWKSVLLIRYTDLTSKWLIICTCQPFDGWIKSSLCYLKYWYMFGNWSMFLLQNAQKCICNWQISNFFREAHMLSTYSC